MDDSGRINNSLLARSSDLLQSKQCTGVRDCYDYKSLFLLPVPFLLLMKRCMFFAIRDKRSTVEVPGKTLLLPDPSNAALFLCVLPALCVRHSYGH